MGETTIKRLLKLYEKTIEDGIIFDGDISDINFYKLLVKADLENKLFTWGINNVCGFKCKYLEKDAILIIISIPIDSSKETSMSKDIAERIIDYIRDAEECFTSLDYNTSIEIQSEKFVYLTIVKIISREGL